MQAFFEENKGIVKFVLLFLGIFLVAAALLQLRQLQYVGSGVNATDTITVQGQGKVDRAPDTAKVSFSVNNNAKDLKTAQDAVSTKVDAITTALKNLGIDDKYIVTDGYNSYPQYDYPTCTPGVFCPNSGTPTIRGYEVSHNITVSIKDLDKVNDVVGVLGQNGVTDMSGPNFGFEDDQEVAHEARDMAITDAKTQAKALAKSLGVHLVRIVSYSENGNGGAPMPVYAQDMASGASVKSAAPALPVGNQTVNSSVSITYEIR